MKTTELEDKILAVLSDGMPHSKHDLLPLFWDAPILDEDLRRRLLCNLRVAISKLREKLLDRGQTIICEDKGKGHPAYYRHVRLLCHAETD